MLIGNQEFISSRDAARLLNYAVSYMRVLCAKEDFRKKVESQKVVNRWFFKKSDILKYGREKGRISELN